MSAALTLPYVWATASAPPLHCEATQAAPGGYAFYRRRTEGLLRRYLQASLAVGRVPSVVPDMTLRGRATNCRRKNFEDIVIFTIDVEKCLRRLAADELRLVVKIAIQEFMFIEAAAQTGMDVRTVARCYGKALDRLTEEFLKRNLLDFSR